MFCETKEAADLAKTLRKKMDKMGRGAIDDSASVASSASGGRRGSFFKSIFHSGSPAPTEPDDKPQEIVSSGKKSKGISKEDIGDPIGFKHLSHIGFNPETGTFDQRNIPPQWQKFLQNSGVKKADLENKDTATFIAKFLDKASKGQIKAPAAAPTAKSGRKAPPPPPPKTCKAVPPPPPPAQSRPAVAATARAQEKPKLSTAKIPQAPPFEDYLAFMEEQKESAAQKHAEEAAAPRPPRPVATGPSLNDALMAGIRGAGVGSLKRVERPDPESLPPMSPSLDAVPGDAMAGLLAKALQNRNRAMAVSDSEDDDDEWS